MMISVSVAVADMFRVAISPVASVDDPCEESASHASALLSAACSKDAQLFQHCRDCLELRHRRLSAKQHLAKFLNASCSRRLRARREPPSLAQLQQSSDKDCRRS
mmetsp:Transcript_37734/g.68237  ORF Transcript_37734/g.68237 Transcript_37734/m.68237 type:complete len:105 (-) Transcript_37734:386-700(-)